MHDYGLHLIGQHKTPDTVWKLRNLGRRAIEPGTRKKAARINFRESVATTTFSKARGHSIYCNFQTTLSKTFLNAEKNFRPRELPFSVPRPRSARHRSNNRNLRPIFLAQLLPEVESSSSLLVASKTFTGSVRSPMSSYSPNRQA